MEKNGGSWKALEVFQFLDRSMIFSFSKIIFNNLFIFEKTMHSYVLKSIYEFNSLIKTINSKRQLKINNKTFGDLLPSTKLFLV